MQRSPRAPQQRCCSSFGEAAGPVVSVAIRMYGSHTSGGSMLAEGGLIERDFRKRYEEKLACASV